MKPTIKISIENVLLRDEFESGKSSLEEEQDYVWYYSYAADNGALDSQVAMGAIYLEGGIAGIERDLHKAFHYFSEAANTQVTTQKKERVIYLGSSSIGVSSLHVYKRLWNSSRQQNRF